MREDLVDSRHPHITSSLEWVVPESQVCGCRMVQNLVPISADRQYCTGCLVCVGGTSVWINKDAGEVIKSD